MVDCDLANEVSVGGVGCLRLDSEGFPQESLVVCPDSKPVVFRFYGQTVYSDVCIAPANFPETVLIRAHTFTVYWVSIAIAFMLGAILASRLI